MLLCDAVPALYAAVTNVSEEVLYGVSSRTISSGGRDLECVQAPVDVVDVLLGSQVMGQRDAQFGSPERVTESGSDMPGEYSVE